MRIPSDIKYIRKVSSEIENFLKEKKIDEIFFFDIRLSVEEAVKNAIIHGNNNNKKLSVAISYFLENDKFRVEIEDEGPGFDPKKVPVPTLEENLLKAGGRGVFLIEKLMDEVKYNRRGNKVTMVKYFRKNKGGNNAN